jgi:hypothetical protein
MALVLGGHAEVSEVRRCPEDGLPLKTPAHEFLHDKIHSLAPDAYHYGQLSMLPFFLYDRVAEVMTEFAAKEGTR